MFNLLGPLTNPACPQHQLIGVYDRHWLVPFAEVCQHQGTLHTLIVNSEDGLDEISIARPTLIADVKDDLIHNIAIKPEDFGITSSKLEPIKVDSPEQSLALILEAYAGKPGPAFDIISLNAGAGLYAADICPDIKTGVEQAQEILKQGKARTLWDDYIKFTNEVKNDA